MKMKEGLKWWADKEEWDSICGTKELEIASVRLLDASGEETGCIEENGSLRVKVEFYAKEAVKSPHFGVAIFREDGLYCFGPNTVIDGFKIDSIGKGKGWFSIYFEDIPFAPGSYRLSVGIWDKKEVLPYSYHPGGYAFKISGSLKNYALNVDKRFKHKGLKPERHRAGPGFIEPDVEFLMKNWKKEFKPDDSHVFHIDLLNRFRIKKQMFKTGQKILIRIYNDVRMFKYAEVLYLWVGIFRKDRLYCHAASVRLTKGGRIILIYPSVSLLAGSYKISTAIFNGRNPVPLALNHGLRDFEIVCKNRYHGLSYIKHNWDWGLP